MDVKTKKMRRMMTESGMRRCGPECGVRKYKAQGLVQCTKYAGYGRVVRSTEIGAEIGQRYGIEG